jgi:Ca-activated chloride channel family protein
VRFVADTAAYGQTEHLRGLLAALKLKPEVIFLLTDGGEPLLDGAQLRSIRELAGGRTSIHCLHFGRGRAPEGEHFLQRLAAENRGSYVYIDMNRRK